VTLPTKMAPPTMSETITQPQSTLNFSVPADPKDPDGPQSGIDQGLEVGFTEPPKNSDDKLAQREYLKGRLAAAYRIFGKCGLNEGAAGHITVRDPIETNTFWVNPFGVNFNLIKKSDLLRVNHHGEVIEHGKVKLLNRAAFAIHAAIHEARPDVVCAAHTHSIHGRAFCSLGRELDMLTLECCTFYNDHVLHAGRGVILAVEEGQDVAEALGPKKALMLQNHGLLTVGHTIEEATHLFYTLDKCCQAQLLADAAASGRGGQTIKMTDEEAAYTYKTVGSHKAAWFSGNMMFDLYDAEHGQAYLE